MGGPEIHSENWNSLIMLVTVIIPTHKRPEALLQALHSLQEQVFPVFEILVVDNADDPMIERKINDFNRSARIVARYIPEAKLGLQYARHKAIQVATGELLLYIDDDVTLDPRWITAYVKAFTDHPEMAAAGGPVRPFWGQTPPPWLLDYIGQSSIFGILSLMEPYNSFQLDGKCYFFGCNMAIKKRILIERGGFHPDSIGDIWIGDGETGLNRDMWAQGDLIGYVPEALVFHHIPPLRMTPAYFRRRWANQGASDVYSKFHDGIPCSLNLFLRIMKRILFGMPIYVMAMLLWDRTSRFALNTQIKAAYFFSEINCMYKLMRDPDYRAMVLKKDWINK